MSRAPVRHKSPVWPAVVFFLAKQHPRTVAELHSLSGGRDPCAISRALKLLEAEGMVESGPQRGSAARIWSWKP